jgi:CRP-like cAMP-binding protein
VWSSSRVRGKKMYNKGSSLEMSLKQIPWLANLSSVELQSIERIGRTCSAAQDEYLFREGDAADSLYLILSGSVDLVRLGADGTEIWLESLSTGEFFGELAIIDGGTRSRAVRARETTELFLIQRRDFLSLVAKSPRMLADFLIGLSGKVRHVNAQYYEAALYLKDVFQVTAAAASVERGQFLVDSLAEVSRRPDALGQLARVFQRMAREVATREQQFKQQIQTLRVEIDEAKKSREVAELTETDFFAQLRKKTKAIRNESK